MMSKMQFRRKRFWYLLPVALLTAMGVLVSTVFLQTPQKIHAAPPGTSTWNMVLEDNFDGSSLNSSKWATCWFWAGSDGGCINEANPQVSYVLPKNVSVSGGSLHLKTVRENYTPPGGTKTYNWTSGMVTTGRIGGNTSQPSKFAFQYGYTEIRAKIASGSGVYSAFWFNPDDHGWPPEIDGFEMAGDRPTINHMTYHWNDSSGNHQYQSQEYFGPNFTSDWHTFGVDWQPGLAIWYIDGQEITRSTVPSGIAAEPMHLLLSSEIWSGGGWTNGPNSSTPNVNEFLVDYVRIWQRQGNASNPPPITGKLPVASTFGTAGIGSSTYDKAFDNNINTAFDASAGSGCHTGMDAGSSYTVKKLRYAPRLWQGTRMNGGQIQGANSQSGPWSTIYTVQHAPASQVFTTVALNNTTAYRYYRYVGPTDGHCNVAEIELYGGSSGGGELTKLNPVGRFGTAGFGSSTYDKASDGNLNTAFDAVDEANCHTGIDAGNNVVVKQVRYSPRYWETDRMPGGQFQGAGSQSGPWNTLYTIGAQPPYGSLTSASLSNTTAYRYYRYVGPSNDGHCNIGEMEYYA